MEIQQQIAYIKGKINDNFNKIISILSTNNDTLNQRHQHGGWSIFEIVEHISLTNFFLLKLIDKAFVKAKKNINQLDLAKELDGYHFQNKNLEQIGEHLAFEWNRPEHMIPQGQISIDELIGKLHHQKEKCLFYLDNMLNGEGVLYKTTMTVNNLGKIDVYQYLYFLAMHMERHIQQIEKIKR